MNLHEYQAKRLLADYGIPVPAGLPATTPAEARAAGEALGGDQWVVKAQIHAGGRGKAGGVKRAYSLPQLEATAGEILGKRLVTVQSPRDGLPVGTILVEAPSSVARELYLSLLVDRSASRVMFVASAAGGMEIEEVARTSPEKILTTHVDPIVGLQPYQCRRLGFALGFELPQIAELTRIMLGLYRLFTDKDLSLIEINPFVITKDGALKALDAKINLDDNALYRQTALVQLRDPSQEDSKEHLAQQFGLNYVALDGEIGCMVNGAGLAMATMDLIKLYGGDPANFLDVGGGTTAERVAEAFKLILSDPKVKAILVNIFGGIVRCDLIAEGVIRAVQEVDVKVPVVVRLEGTNVDQGVALLRDSGLNVTTTESLSDAAQRVVAAAKGQG